MKFDKRTLTIVGASTAIGFIGDVLTYSVAASRGGSFKVVVPKGKELFWVLILGVIGGFAIDYAVKQVEEGLKIDEEKFLDRLVSKEKEVIAQYIGKKPTKILWI